MKYCERNVIAKLIKMYIVHNPRCTAKDISLSLTDNKFGLSDNITPTNISTIIRDYNADSRCKWFNVNVNREKDPCRYNIKRRT